MSNRRDFLKKSSLLGLAGLTSKLISNNQLNAIESLGNQTQTNDAFTLAKLPYSYGALEPYFDKQTMEIHYTKHHQGYVDKLNALTSTNIDYASTDAVKCTHINKTTTLAVVIQKFFPIKLEIMKRYFKCPADCAPWYCS